jgi:hypothetical protein
MTTSTNDTTPALDTAPPDCQEEDVDNATPPTMPRRGKNEWFKQVYEPWWRNQLKPAQKNNDEKTIDALRDQYVQVEKQALSKYEFEAMYWSDETLIHTFGEKFKECQDAARNLPVFILIKMATNQYSIEFKTAHKFSRLLLNTTDRVEFFKYIKMLRYSNISIITRAKGKIRVDEDTTYCLFTVPPDSWLESDHDYKGQYTHKHRRLFDDASHWAAIKTLISLGMEGIGILTQAFEREGRAKKKMAKPQTPPLAASSERRDGIGK